MIGAPEVLGDVRPLAEERGRDGRGEERGDEEEGCATRDQILDVLSLVKRVRRDSRMERPCSKTEVATRKETTAKIWDSSFDVSGIFSAASSA